jgi:c-di-AMP phosphodiesterase-like protein
LPQPIYTITKEAVVTGVAAVFIRETVEFENVSHLEDQRVDKRIKTDAENVVSNLPTGLVVFTSNRWINAALGPVLRRNDRIRVGASTRFLRRREGAV